MTNQPIKGGEYITRDVHHSEVFTPEEWNEEQKMIAQMCDDFIQQEVLPHLDRIDNMEDGLMKSIRGAVTTPILCFGCFSCPAMIWSAYFFAKLWSTILEG